MKVNVYFAYVSLSRDRHFSTSKNKTFNPRHLGYLHYCYFNLNQYICKGVLFVRLIWLCTSNLFENRNSMVLKYFFSDTFLFFKCQVKQSISWWNVPTLHHQGYEAQPDGNQQGTKIINYSTEKKENM